MFIINSSRPKSGIISFQSFRFSKANKRSGLNISEKLENLESQVLIAGFKQFQIVNYIRRKLNFSHTAAYLFISSFNSSIDYVTPFPSSISVTDLFRRFQYCSLLSFLKPISALSCTAIVMSAYLLFSNAEILLKRSSLNSDDGNLKIASIK